MNFFASVFFGFLIAVGAYADPKVDPVELEKEIALAIGRIPELKFIQQLAKQEGLKVYLTGRQAAILAHYVKVAMVKKSGPLTEWERKRLSYKFEEVFGRGKVRLDFMYDADPQDLREQAVRDRGYSTGYILGNEEILAIRIDGFVARLKAKYPKIETFDSEFPLNRLSKARAAMNQIATEQDINSYSAGLLAFDDDNELNARRGLSQDFEGRFLADIAQHKITYKLAPNRALGDSSRLFSALEYLFYVSRFNLQISDAAFANLKGIVKNVDFSELSKFEKANALEMAEAVMRQAYNLEETWDLLEELGLRQKLIALDKLNINKKGSVAWWLNKEPVRKRLISHNSTEPQTAASLGMADTLLSHTTRGEEAMDSITLPTSGEVNLFKSRLRTDGESAAQGPGVYMQFGVKGHYDRDTFARIIVYRLKPDAIHGIDFFYVSGGLVRILTKDAIEAVDYREPGKEQAEGYLADIFELEKLFAAAKGGNKGSYIRLKRVVDYVRKSPTREAEFTDRQRRVYSQIRIYVDMFEQIKSISNVFNQKFIESVLARMFSQKTERSPWRKLIDTLAAQTPPRESFVDLIIPENVKPRSILFPENAGQGKTARVESLLKKYLGGRHLEPYLRRFKEIIPVQNLKTEPLTCQQILSDF